MNKIDENKFDSKKIKVSIFDNLLNSIAQNQNKIKVKGISGSSISVLIHKLFKKLDVFKGQNRHLEDDASMVIFQLK